MELPKRIFGGVDRGAAERAIAEQRRTVADLTEHLTRVEAQLHESRAERDEARAQLREMQAQIADVLRLATRAAAETEAEVEARTTAATEEARRRVAELEGQASTAEESVLALAAALTEAVERHRSKPPIRVSADAPGTAPGESTQGGLDEPDEPFVEPEEALATPLVAAPPSDEQPAAASGGSDAVATPIVVPPPDDQLSPSLAGADPVATPIVVPPPHAEPSPSPSAASEQPAPWSAAPAHAGANGHAQTTVVARPLPTPAAAVEIERRLVELPGVRQVTLQRLASHEATFAVHHEGALDLGPLVAAGVPVTVE